MSIKKAFKGAIKSHREVHIHDDVFVFINNSLAHHIGINTARKIGTDRAWMELLNNLAFEITGEKAEWRRHTFLTIAAAAIGAFEDSVRRDSQLATTKEEDDAQVKGFKGEATYTVK